MLFASAEEGRDVIAEGRRRETDEDMGEGDIP
jgi:hypothetical protein